MNETLDALRWKKFKVLDDGFVSLVDVMGDDAAIVQAARVSYGEGTKRVSDDRNLIRYLLRHRHTTPFEMAELKLLVRVPMDAWRQWIRHRTANVNEYSTRYSLAIDSAQHTPPDQWRAQSDSNKQGSGGFITDDQNDVVRAHVDAERARTTAAGLGSTRTIGEMLSEQEAEFLAEAREVYEHRISCGMAREQARKDLPLSTYTEAYWKCDLHNLLHFLGLRMDGHAQSEIRQYATVIGEEIVKPLFPLVWEAFTDYRLGGIMLNRLDIDIIKHMVSNNPFRNGPLSETAFKTACVIAGPEEWRQEKCRERDESLAKLAKIGLVARDGT